MKINSPTKIRFITTQIDYSRYEQLLHVIQSVKLQYITYLRDQESERELFSSYLAVLKDFMEKK
jgi:hypothetical protein